MAFFSWIGWRNIWSLNVAPKVIFFVWLVIHWRIKTSQYLYFLKLGPGDPYRLCGLEKEDILHLFSHCFKFQCIWKHIEELTRVKIHQNWDPTTRR